MVQTISLWRQGIYSPSIIRTQANLKRLGNIYYPFYQFKIKPFQLNSILNMVVLKRTFVSYLLVGLQCLNSRQHVQKIKQASQSKKNKAKKRKGQMTNFPNAYVHKWVKQVLQIHFPQFIQDKRLNWKTIKTGKDILKILFKLRKLFDDTQWTMMHQQIEKKMSDQMNMDKTNTFNECYKKFSKCLGNIGNFHWKQAIEAIYLKEAKRINTINKYFKNEMIDPRNLERKL